MLFNNFLEASTYLGQKEDRPAPSKMGSPRATRIIRLNDNKIGLRYHNTDVVVYEPDWMSLYSGGWFTVTTKARINAALPNNVTLWQEKGVWYLSFRDKGEVGWSGGTQCVFEEGLQISYEGTLLSEAELFSKDTLKEMRQKTRRIKKYVNAFMDALEAGQIEKPSGGDCWACLALLNNPDEESPLGHSHLDLHIEESYFVPSLLYAALTHGASSMSMKWWVQAMIEHTDQHIGNERERVTRLLYRFMKTRRGVGS